MSVILEPDLPPALGRCPLCAKSRHQRRAALGTYIPCEISPDLRRAILPIHPIHFVALQISTDGNPNCRKEEGFADLRK
jgi:hypothetical protein